MVNPYNVSGITSDVFATDKSLTDFQNPGHTFLPTFPLIIFVQTDRHDGRSMLTK